MKEKIYNQRISPKNIPQTIALKKPRGLTLTDTHENMFL